MRIHLNHLLYTLQELYEFKEEEEAIAGISRK
jgi:hypothetical protein